MHLKLYIESSIPVITALRTRLVQLNRSDQVRQEHSRLWKCQEFYRLLEHRFRGHAKDQGDVTYAGSSTDLQRGWLCCPSDTLGTAWGVPRLPHRALGPTHVCLLPSPHSDQACTELWNQAEDLTHRACLHCKLTPGRSWSWALWGIMSWPGSVAAPSQQIQNKRNFP